MERKIISFVIIGVMALTTILGETAMAAGPALEAPQSLTVEVKEHPDGKPYFLLKWNNPKSILELVEYWDDNGEAYTGYQIDMKVANGRWDYEIEGDTITGNSLHAGYDETGVFAVCEAAYDPINDGELDTVDIKANVYQFRVRYSYLYSEDEERVEEYYIYSPFSNVASIGMEKYYKNASGWATAELDKAASYGLITDSIKDNMSGPITREEFAELATRLYEVYTGKTAQAAPASTFTDTTNPEILKAFNLGIVNGVGGNKFDPKTLTNREQIAAMLYRAVTVINPDADMSIEGAPAFADQSQIESYFMDNVKFMGKNGFITGMGNNTFAPKAQCTREAAVLIAVRVYEAYK